MKRLLSAFLAFYLAAGVLPVQVMAEETVPPAGEQTEETGEITAEETETELYEDAEEAEEPAVTVPEETAEEPQEAEEEQTVPGTAEEDTETEEPVPEVTELPEASEEPVIEETPVPEVTAESEEAVPEETELPEASGEPVIEETAVPEITAGAEEEQPAEETAGEPEEVPAAAETEPVIEETAEPVIEETDAQPEEPAEADPEPVTIETDETETASEAAGIIEDTEEAAAPAEAPMLWTLTFDANGGLFDKHFAETEEDVPTWQDQVKMGIPYHVEPNDYYKVHRSGYAFAGWYGNKSLEPQYELQANGYFMPEGNPEKYTVYAKWVPAYTVTFMTNGGMFTDESDQCVREVEKGKTIGSCPWGDPAGYDRVFTGWTLKKNDASSKIDLEYYIPEKNTTLYALWYQEIEIVCDANGGQFSSGAEKMTIVCAKDRTADLSSISEPSKSGSAFCGWYTDPSLAEKYKAGKDFLVTKKMTLYAKYSKYCSVTFDGNGRSWLGYMTEGTYVSGKPSVVKKVPAGAALFEVSVPYTIPPSGYSFQGWYTDKACSAHKQVDPFSFVPEKDMTLYAKWSRIFKITFDGRGGKAEDGSASITVKVAEDRAVGQAPGFTNGTKAFAGWYTDKACTKKVAHVYGYYPVTDMTFYAKWVSGVKVKFSANGGKFSDGSKTTAIYARKGTQLRQNVERPERKGYIFAGWYTDTSFKTKVEDPFFYKVNGAAKLYAKWLKAIKVTFDAGDGVIETYDSETGYQVVRKYTGYYGKGTVAADSETYMHHNISGAAGTDAYMMNWLPYPYIPGDTGKEFEGWYKDKDLKKRFDAQKDRFTEAITLYAKYTGKYTDSYVKITVDTNGGRLSKDFGKTFSLKKNSRFQASLETVIPPEGKMLCGFTKTKNDPSTLLTQDFICTDDMTVYAYFQPVCTVTLNAMSGFLTHGSYGDGYVYDVMKVYTERVIKGGTIERFTYDHGGDHDSLATNVDGRVFRGWYADKEFKNFVTYDISTYKVKKDITLYAKWGSPEKPGWKKTKGQWWYRTANGDYYRNEFRRIGKSTYYFKASGYIATGWQKIGGSWYWFADSGAMAAGWKKISGKWYYFTDSGVMVTGWQKISGKWYYFTGGGAMVTGWKKLSGKWYYFLSSGAMATGWKKISGKWYYFLGSGAMVTGSRKIGSKTYQFSSSGECLNP